MLWIRTVGSKEQTAARKRAYAEPRCRCSKTRTPRNDSRSSQRRRRANLERRRLGRREQPACGRRDYGHGEGVLGQGWKQVGQGRESCSQVRFTALLDMTKARFQLARVLANGAVATHLCLAAAAGIGRRNRRKGGRSHRQRQERRDDPARYPAHDLEHGALLPLVRRNVKRRYSHRCGVGSSGIRYFRYARTTSINSSAASRWSRPLGIRKVMFCPWMISARRALIAPPQAASVWKPRRTPVPDLWPSRLHDQGVPSRRPLTRHPCGCGSAAGAGRRASLRRVCSTLFCRRCPTALLCRSLPLPSFAPLSDLTNTTFQLWEREISGPQ